MNTNNDEYNDKILESVKTELTLSMGSSKVQGSECTRAGRIIRESSWFKDYVLNYIC